jgi:hypothetical protein
MVARLGSNASAGATGQEDSAVSTVGLDHAHAFGQIEGPLNQGCQLVGLSLDDPAASVAQSGRLAIRAQESATMTRFAK